MPSQFSYGGTHPPEIITPHQAASYAILGMRKSLFECPGLEIIVSTPGSVFIKKATRCGNDAFPDQDTQTGFSHRMLLGVE